MYRHPLRCRLRRIRCGLGERAALPSGRAPDIANHGAAQLRTELPPGVHAQRAVLIPARLSNSEHESHTWRIREVAPDFRLEDVWALPAEGGAEEFAALLEVMASLDPAEAGSRISRALFAIRYRVGGWLG